ncbi:hypothetical protein AB0C59_32510 [Streptomyces sp. NPDC048664]|uniref:hypothetical protein n=1 Tax=Streptomyces sp. NPDC048664 TaxID=3154505 RepID=UPI00343081BD
MRSRPASLSVAGRQMVAALERVMVNAMWRRGAQGSAAGVPVSRPWCGPRWVDGDGTVLLEAGVHWDMVSVPRGLGLLVLDILWYDPLCTPGPTMVDSAADRVGFFVPPRAAARWDGDGIRHVTRGAWVAVPSPYLRGQRVEWIVPPDGSGALHPPLVLEPALRRARRTLAVLATAGAD